jgi:hypothetical protein
MCREKEKDEKRDKGDKLMEKYLRWPKPKNAGQAWSDFLVVPLPKVDPSAPQDASFGDFNGPLLEQERDEDGKASCSTPDQGN